MSDTLDSADDQRPTEPLTEPVTGPRTPVTEPQPVLETQPLTEPQPFPGTAAWAASVPALRPRPRVRAAAIVWGVIVSALASAILFAIGAPERRTAVAGWVDTLTGESIALLSILVGGAIILLVAVLGAIRRAERRSTR